MVEADRDRKWVKLRNARIPFSAANVDFICELLARLLAGDRDLLEVMDFVLGLLEELDSDGDIQAGLLEKKIFTLKISSRPNRGLAECKAATWKP